MKKKFYNIGDFRHRAQFQKLSTTSDGAGGFTNSYTTVSTVPCRIEPKSGTERLESGQVIGNVTYDIVVRHSSNFSPLLDNDYKINIASGIYQGSYNIKSSILMDGAVKYYHIVAVKK